MAEADALLHLQSIDLELIRSRKRLEELPEKEAILVARAKIREVDELGRKAKMLVHKLESELKARQDEIATLTEKIDAEQKKLMETADHRQVQAITREMDGLRRRVDKLEMESLQFMERIEKAGSQAETIARALDDLKVKEAALIEKFKAVGGELQQAIAALEADRAKTASSIPADLLKRYEAVRSSKGGIGVGTLSDTTCTACRMSLPAERVRDLVSGPEIGVCPQCRRLIVVRPSEDS